MLDTVLAGADERLRDEDGVPMAWPVKMAGDKGYRAAWIDEYLLGLGVLPRTGALDRLSSTRRPIAVARLLSASSVG